MKKIRPLLKYHGGKYYLCDKIIPLLPPHDTYTEVFGGGANVLLNKSPSKVEVFNDIDPDLIHLYRILQHYPSDIIILSRDCKYTKSEFEKQKNFLQSDNPWKKAVAYLVRNRMSRGGMGQTFASSNRMRGGVMGDANAWRTFLFYHLPKICNRFKDVKIFCDDGASVMEGWDSPTTTHFCDPPYLPETRTAKEVYNYEMTFAQHERFLKAALRMQGAVVISGYHHPLYDETLSGWKLYEFVMPNHSGQNKKKQRRVECLWVSK